MLQQGAAPVEMTTDGDCTSHKFVQLAMIEEEIMRAIGGKPLLILHQTTVTSISTVKIVSERYRTKTNDILKPKGRKAKPCLQLHPIFRLHYKSHSIGAAGR